MFQNRKYLIDMVFRCRIPWLKQFNSSLCLKVVTVFKFLSRSGFSFYPTEYNHLSSANLTITRISCDLTFVTFRKVFNVSSSVKDTVQPLCIPTHLGSFLRQSVERKHFFHQRRYVLIQLFDFKFKILTWRLHNWFKCNSSVNSAALIAFGKSCLLANISRTASRSSSSCN